MKRNQSLIAAPLEALTRVSVITTFTQDADGRRGTPRHQQTDNQEHITPSHTDRHRWLTTATKERIADLFPTLLGAFTMNTHKVKRTVSGTLKLISLAAIIVLPLAMNPEPAHAGAYTPSSFDSTCSSIRYVRGWWNRKPYVYAQCPTNPRNVGWIFEDIKTSLKATNTPIRGIHVVHGALRQNLLTGASTFQNSCRGVSVKGDRLTATCPDYSRKGILCGYKSRTSTITLAEITNSDGSLHYEDETIINDTANAVVNHAYAKHKGEFGNPSKAKFKAMIVDIIKHPTEKKTVDRIKDEQKDVVAVFWKNGTIVIAQSGSLLDRSTAFKPKKGKAYYDNFK